MRSTSAVNNYPLSWPASWPRTPTAKRQHARFSSKSNTGSTWRSQRELTTHEGVVRVRDEIDRLRADAFFISTNVKVNREGLPYSGTREPDDPGVAVYFTVGGKERVLACDRWTRVADNLAAIAAHIGALRGMERWGVGTIDQAFAGYAALPAKGETSASSWRSVLGVDDGATLDEAEAAFRYKARMAHPDITGGSTERMSALIAARDDARRELGGGAK